MKNRTQIIEDLLLQFGVRPNLKGFPDAVVVTRLWMEAQDAGDRSPCITKIYISAAQELGTTRTRIERTIRHAIELIYLVADAFDDEVADYLFPPQVASKGKLTNAEFISVIALLARREEEKQAAEAPAKAYDGWRGDLEAAYHG